MPLVFPRRLRSRWSSSGAGKVAGLLTSGESLKSPAVASYSPEAERTASGEILAQAQWLYEQHERRVQNCQNMAVALLTIVGTVLALLAPSAVMGQPAAWQFLALGVVFVGGLGTMAQCMRVLTPRVRLNGLPAVGALREFAHKHETLTASLAPIPVTQFATDLLNPLHLTASSPLTESSADAERRTSALAQAYRWFAVTFVLVIAVSTLFALLG